MSLQDPVALSTIASLLAACLVLIAGALLPRNVRLLARYNIPDPIVGGLLFAILVTLVGAATGLRLSLDVAAVATRSVPTVEVTDARARARQALTAETALERG